jgi:DNA invertase Pin-like site-specific DNA recombinase
MMRLIIAYLRTSTRRRHAAALDIDGQLAAVRGYAAEAGATVAGWYLEVEKGTEPPRPQLRCAVEAASRFGARLVVAKADRLARSDAFRTILMSAPVEFCCLDKPYLDRRTLPLIAEAEKFESEQARRRTREGLAAAKARGVRLGSSREGHWTDLVRARARDAGIRKAAANAARVRAEQARTAYDEVKPLILQLRGQGSSLQAIADRLNAAGHTTRREKRWNPMQVGRVIRRAGAAGSELMQAAAAALAVPDLFTAPPRTEGREAAAGRTPLA